MKHKIKLVEFKRSHNAEYATWFSDVAINQYLGPVWTDKELTETFAEEHSAVLSAYLADELVGVVSVSLPHPGEKRFGIPGIAVTPKRKRSGIGLSILCALQDYYNTRVGQEWVAFVDPSNYAAEALLNNAGWKKGKLENKLYLYTFFQ